MSYTLDPSTGIYIDPVSGATSMDPLGQTAVTNPSLVQQAKRNLAVSHGLLDTLGKYGQNFDQSITGERALSQHLNEVIGGTAPSVAGEQMQQGLGQARAAADSIASGASGPNAGIARLQAIQTGGNLDAQAIQQAALLRAQEQAAAVQNQGAVLGNIATQNAQMYGTGLAGAGQFSGLAGNEAAQQAQLDEQRSEFNKRMIANLVAAGGAGLATIATGGAAAPVAGAAAQGIAAGAAGNAAANGAGDVTAGLPPIPVASGATNEDLLGVGSTPVANYPSAADTHAMVQGLTSPSPEDQANLVNTGLASGSAYTSDENEKTEIKKAPMEELLDHIAGFTYGYKEPGEPGEPGGQRVGPMAQDVRQGGPIGRSMVIDGKPLKMDIPNALGATLAAVSYLNDQIKQLKGSRKAA